jgi:uncharacterized Zn finger protein
MLDNLITRDTLEDLAGTTAFRRGEQYFSVGAVGRLRAAKQSISAKVEGSETYSVKLWDDDGALGYECTCPHAVEGYFCKHCVALGLAWLAEHSAGRDSGGVPDKQKRPDPWSDIRNYLSTQPPERLINLLLQAAQEDERLHRSLLLKTECNGGSGNLVKAFRRAIDSVTRIQSFVDWSEAGIFAGNVDQVAESLAELLKPDTAAILVELVEYAIERVEKALEQLDDSNGHVGSTLQGLGELHQNACDLAKPDPIALADRLFRCEMTLPFGTFHDCARQYQETLGEVGLKRFRELAEAEWRKVKRVGNAIDEGRSYDQGRWRITQIMETLAELSGDVESLVAIKACDLSSAWRYLTICEIYTKCSQHDKALEWAERGLKAFPENTDNRLRDFLVAGYIKRRRSDEALQLTWIQFEERPNLEHYKKLHDVAERLGVWPAQRNRARALVAEVIAHGAAATSRWKPKASVPDYSLRVEIALWERDFDAAWATANEGICHHDLLIALAGKLQPSRPNDAITLYRRVVPRIVEQTNNAAYAEAIKLIRRVMEMMNAQGKSGEFRDYLAELRVQFKPKRNFINLLDRVARAAVEAKRDL